MNVHPSQLRYRVMTLDMMVSDSSPVNLDGDDEWQRSRPLLEATDLRNGYVMSLIAGSSPTLGATVRPVAGPLHSEPRTAYQVTVTADNGVIVTDEVVYLV